MKMRNLFGLSQASEGGGKCEFCYLFLTQDAANLQSFFSPFLIHSHLVKANKLFYFKTFTVTACVCCDLQMVYCYPYYSSSGHLFRKWKNSAILSARCQTCYARSSRISRKFMLLGFWFLLHYLLSAETKITINLPNKSIRSSFLFFSFFFC